MHRDMLTALGSLGVISGVIWKNTTEQLGYPHASIGKVGVALFIIGWIILTYGIVSRRKTSVGQVAPILGALAIVSSVMMMKPYQIRGETPPIQYPIMFALGWIIFGLSISAHMGGSFRYIGLVATAFVLSSMMGILPWARKNCVIDNPGYVLFTLAFVLIVAINHT